MLRPSAQIEAPEPKPQGRASLRPRTARVTANQPDPAAALALALGPGPFALVLAIADPALLTGPLQAELARGFAGVPLAGIAGRTLETVGTCPAEPVGADAGSIHAIGFPAEGFAAETLGIDGPGGAAPQRLLPGVAGARARLEAWRPDWPHELGLLLLAEAPPPAEDLYGLVSAALSPVPLLTAAALARGPQSAAGGASPVTGRLDAAQPGAEPTSGRHTTGRHTTGRQAPAPSGTAAPAANSVPASTAPRHRPSGAAAISPPGAAASGHFGTAASLILVRCRAPVRLLTLGRYAAAGPRLIVTRAEGARLLRLNDAPAAEEYARYLGLDAAGLTPAVRAGHPFSRAGADAPELFAVLEAGPGGSLRLSAPVPQGAALRIAAAVDPAAALTRGLAPLTARHGAPLALLGFTPPEPTPEPPAAGGAARKVADPGDGEAGLIRDIAKLGASQVLARCGAAGGALSGKGLCALVFFGAGDA